jgi:hypothetical protein
VNTPEKAQYHLTLANGAKYMTNMSVTTVVGMEAANSFINSFLWTTKSKVLVISIAQAKISPPFLRKESLVSTTSQVHMLVVHCRW